MQDGCTFMQLISTVMKKFKFTIVLLVGVFYGSSLFSQRIGISDVSHTPDFSAVLDVYSTSKGILIPRITDSTSITQPVKGLFAFFNTTKTFWFYDSTKWCEIIASNVNETVKLGGVNDFIKIEPDGSIFLEGDATAFDDLRTPVLATVKSTSVPPDNIVFGSNMVAFGFDKAKSEEVFFMVQIPHPYKEGSNIYPHVHWYPTDNTTGNVVWKLEYTWANANNVFPSSTTLSVTTAAAGTAVTHQIASFSYIDGTGKKISSMLVCRLYREGGNAQDTYNADAGLLEIDFHFEIDSFGSRVEFIK